MLGHFRWRSLATSPPVQPRRFVVVVEATESFTRVHTFHFGLSSLRSRSSAPLVLLNHAVESDGEGLGGLVDDPAAAAQSLLPQLRSAEASIPASLRSATPLTFRITSELALHLGRRRSERLLFEVREVLHASFRFRIAPALSDVAAREARGGVANPHAGGLGQDLGVGEWGAGGAAPVALGSALSVLDGGHRAASQWLAVNFLAGRLHRGRVKGTLGVVDVDGVDAQLAYAVEGRAAAKAAAASGAAYVSRVAGAGGVFNLYAHSHAGFGASAVRAKVLRPSHVGAEAAHGQGHPCLEEVVVFPFGNASWEGGAVEAGHKREAASQARCSAVATRLLRRSPCPPWRQEECSFGGAWGGGGGVGAQLFYASGALFDTALHAGLVPPGSLSASTTPHAFRKAAGQACGLEGPALKRAFKRGPAVGSADLALFCWDLSYAHALLSHGLGIAEEAPLVAVRRLQYRNRLVEAHWALGDAIAALGDA